MLRAQRLVSFVLGRRHLRGNKQVPKSKKKSDNFGRRTQTTFIKSVVVAFKPVLLFWLRCDVTTQSMTRLVTPTLIQHTNHQTPNILSGQFIKVPHITINLSDACAMSVPLVEGMKLELTQANGRHIVRWHALDSRRRRWYSVISGRT